jgi:glycosyltransferase involved in cell wall biosynthesis
MKLSVIIPAYNAAGHLKEAVMSVKSQEGYDPKDCQITVIDDGSTDTTRDLAKEFYSPELSEDERAGLKPKDTPYEGTLPGCSLIKRSVLMKPVIFRKTFTAERPWNG